MSNPFAWVAGQLAGARRVEPATLKFNPRPPGVIQAGSASEAVLRVLRAHPETFFTNGQLIKLTGRSHSAISWALKFLAQHGHIKTIKDGARNERWFLYLAANRQVGRVVKFP